MKLASIAVLLLFTVNSCKKDTTNNLDYLGNWHGCSSESITDEAKLDESAERMEVCGITGIVSTEGCNTITISTHVTGSIDSKIMAMPSNLPEDYQIDGLQIEYSGLLVKANHPPSCLRTGGTASFNLTIEKIKKKQ